MTRLIRGIATSAAIALAAASGVTPARGAVTPTDRAATHAYLLAVESWDQAQLINLPRSIAATEALATQISGECSGVLSGAPPPEHELGPTSAAAQPTQPSARMEGERQRESRQRLDLQLELSTAEGDVLNQPNREAMIALVAALSPLRWSNPLIGLSLHVTLEILQAELNSPIPAVCTDMRFWVASGYKMLSPSSKEASKRAETFIKDAFKTLALYEGAHVKPFPQILVPYESAADRTLARQIAAHDSQLRREKKFQQAVLMRIETALGLPVKQPEPIRHPVRKPAAVGRGTTAAGGRFVVRAERVGRVPRILRREGCSANVTIEEPARPYNGGLLSILSDESPDRCLSRSSVKPEQKVHCASGLLTVEANLLPNTRSVRLLLSDNRTIVSPAVQIPARLGGPAGLYYQVVRGPSPIPVSLTELDAGGRTLTTLKLPAVVECFKHLRRYFPRGVVRLVDEHRAQGPPVTIRGERYRELGHINFELKLEEPQSEELFDGGNGGGRINEKVEEGVGQFGREVFESHASQGCLPQPYAIVYGLLRAPRETVLATVSGRLVPLRNVGIPAHLHAGGVLAYGVFSPIPTALSIRDSHGKTIATKDLLEASKSDTETCEGESEG